VVVCVYTSERSERSWYVYIGNTLGVFLNQRSEIEGWRLVDMSTA
jgi:hypothetical protein